MYNRNLLLKKENMNDNNVIRFPFGTKLEAPASIEVQPGVLLSADLDPEPDVPHEERVAEARRRLVERHADQVLDERRKDLAAKMAHIVPVLDGKLVPRPTKK